MKSNKYRGFTLVEVLMALAIVAFAGVTIMGLFSSSVQTAQQSISDTEAALFAREIMNGIRSFQSDPDAAGSVSITVFGQPVTLVNGELPPVQERWQEFETVFITVPTVNGATTEGVVYFQ